MRKCASSQVCGCPVLGNVCATPVSFDLSAKIRSVGIARSERDGTRAETRIGLSAKWTSPFKSAGGSGQSTTGSRGVRISGQRLYYL